LIAEPPDGENQMAKVKIKSGSTVAPKTGWGLGIALFVIFLFFVIPIYSAFIFSIEVGDGTYSAEPYINVFRDPGFSAALWLSTKLSIITVAIVLFLMVPTVTWLHVRAQRAKRLVEFITLLPLVIPPVVTALGLLNSMPLFLIDSYWLLGFAYGALTMPYTYRALDSALSAIDVRTLVDASRGLGASWREVLTGIIAPNIKSGIFAALFLAIALVLGEFVVASLLLWKTLPTWIALVGMSNAEGAVALSVMALVLVWLLLVIISLFDRKKKVGQTQAKGAV
jgi:putative spermidine/putrescine transport system permease protein